MQVTTMCVEQGEKRTNRIVTVREKNLFDIKSEKEQQNCYRFSRLMIILNL